MANSTHCALHRLAVNSPLTVGRASRVSCRMIATAVVRRDVFRECVQMCQPDFLQAFSFALSSAVTSVLAHLFINTVIHSIASQHSFNLVVERWFVWSNRTTCTTVHALAIRAVIAEAKFRQEERHMPGVLGWHNIHPICRFLHLYPNHKASRLGVS